MALPAPPQPTLSDRRSGVLLHPTSLPGPHGSGDLGPAAYRFIDDLADAGQSWWQMLPINPPSRPPGNSPYSSSSALASSPWLISPELLYKDDGLLTKADLPPRTADHPTLADFVRSRTIRTALLRKAHDNAQQHKLDQSPEFQTFCNQNAHWLPDFTLFAALTEKFDLKPWLAWPAPLRSRNPKALASARRDLADEIAFHTFCQFLFDRQWRRLHSHASSRGIGLIGDLPIFVSHNSADVWAHPELFLLDRTGRPTLVSGAPPDEFSRTGQKWNHPHYRWPNHRKSHFAWWKSRVDRLFTYFDCIRIDHFLGFHRAWAVPTKGKATQGHWIPSPGAELFTALGLSAAQPRVIAEDLGATTPEALALRDRFGFPGMRVLQFGFTSSDYHLPHRYTPHCVAYTGTHDNNTIVGWLRTLSDAQRARAAVYTGLHPGRPDPWPFIRAVSTSIANTVIVPAQDLLALGSQDRMNTPGSPSDNWIWRMPRPLPAAAIHKLLRLTQSAGRLPP